MRFGLGGGAGDQGEEFGESLRSKHAFDDVRPAEEPGDLRGNLELRTGIAGGCENEEDHVCQPIVGGIEVDPRIGDAQRDDGLSQSVDTRRAGGPLRFRCPCSWPLLAPKRPPRWRLQADRRLRTPLGLFPGWPRAGMLLSDSAGKASRTACPANAVSSCSQG